MQESTTVLPHETIVKNSIQTPTPASRAAARLGWRFHRLVKRPSPSGPAPALPPRDFLLAVALTGIAILSLVAEPVSDPAGTVHSASRQNPWRQCFHGVFGQVCHAADGEAPTKEKPAGVTAPSKLLRFDFTRTEMAVPVRLLLYAPDEATANRAADAAYARMAQLNNIMSDYEPESELRRLDATAGEGKAIPVSNELWEVVNHAQALSERSQGAFDITVGPIIQPWRKARRVHQLPPADKLKDALQLVGYKNVRLEVTGHAIELRKRGMHLDLGGVAKGYANDKAMEALRAHGVTRAMIHSGGDVLLGDPPPEKPGWIVGIAALDLNSPPLGYISISRCAMGISGDMFQKVVIDGKRYSHIVDPRTGIGLTDHSTVTIVAPDGITADGLSTAVSVLGPERGLRLVEDTPRAAGFFLHAPDGKEQRLQSSRWKDLPTVKPQTDKDRKASKGKAPVTETRPAPPRP